MISLFFLELSVRTIRAPTWCWASLERMFRITSTLAADLIIFYVFSIHIESINVGHKSKILCENWLVTTDSQGEFFFLIPSIKLWQSSSLLSFPDSEDCVYLPFYFGISALHRALLPSSLWANPGSYPSPSVPWQAIQRESQVHKFWPIPSGQLRLWCWLISLGTGFYFILGGSIHLWFFFSSWVPRWL